MKYSIKEKIENLIKDIYIKSKNKITFNKNEVRKYHKVGAALLNVLTHKALINKVGTGQYIYIGPTPDNNLIDEILIQYSDYNKNKHNKYSNKNILNKKINYYNKNQDERLPKDIEQLEALCWTCYIVGMDDERRKTRNFSTWFEHVILKEKTN